MSSSPESVSIVAGIAATAHCGYNDYMTRSSVVGARELKTRLGHFLQRVRQGETLLVTDRGEPVAELRAVAVGASPIDAVLRRLAADGAITLPLKNQTSTFQAIASRGAAASTAVSRDREERG